MELPGPTADITDRIVPMVQGNTLWMRVGAAETGPDPAPDVFKTLRITYSYQGKDGLCLCSRHSEPSGSAICPAPWGQSGAIHIIRAEYGPLDNPKEIRDVSRRVAGSVKGNSLKLIVGDRALWRNG